MESVRGSEKTPHVVLARPTPYLGTLKGRCYAPPWGVVTERAAWLSLVGACNRGPVGAGSSRVTSAAEVVPKERLYKWYVSRGHDEVDGAIGHCAGDHYERRYLHHAHRGATLLHVGLPIALCHFHLCLTQ